VGIERPWLGRIAAMQHRFGLRRRGGGKHDRYRKRCGFETRKRLHHDKSPYEKSL
jgi:hypothetical protein